MKQTMGYDFMLVRVNRKADRTFPLASDALSSDDFAGRLPWNEFRDWLVLEGGTENGPDNIYVDYGKGNGGIDYSGGGYGSKGGSIYLDVHAQWSKVVEAYEHMLTLEPESCVYDPQAGDIHDKESFAKFVYSHTDSS